jgi:endonuclease YncB( thermonuclease family)
MAAAEIRRKPEASSMTRPEGTPSPQERLRTLIRSEVARARPVEGSRSAIELIVESSARPSGEDGVAILDRLGEPRFVERDGARFPFSIADLLDELRQQHPTLFEATEEPPHGATVSGDIPVPAGPPPRRRDWLDLSTPKADAAPATPEPLGPAGASEPPRIAVHLSSPVREPQAVKPASAIAAPSRTAHKDELPRPRRRWPVALGAGALVLPVVLAVALALGRKEAPHPPRVEQAQAPSKPKATPTPSAREPDRPDSAEDPGATGAVRAVERVPLRGVPEVLDTTTLSLEGRIVRLFGVEWARGAGNPDDLAKYIRGREVACTPVAAGEAFRCQVDGQDLSRVILYNGGGRATSDATPDLKAAEEQARARSVGVWGDKVKALP